jgi:citronellol/citronellal dehydrogenase
MSVLSDDANAGAVALVTGGGTGIGRATALELGRTGARVVIAGRREEPLEQTRAELERMGVDCVARPTDIRESEESDALVGEALGAFDRIDVLVNNAGGQFSAPAEEITLKGWRAVHRLAVDATWHLTRTVALRSMIPNRRGVIFFNAFSPRRGIPGYAHAASARAGLENLAGGLAAEWGQHGIRVIALALGNIHTEGLEGYGDDLDSMAADVPLGRLGTPEEVAVATAFLASPAAGYVSGTTVTIDGGLDAT